MPRPIKKRVVKKTDAQEEVLNLYERWLDFYHANTGRVQRIAVAVTVVIAALAVLYVYLGQREKRAAVLESRAYTAYREAVASGNTALLQEASRKFADAYDMEKSPALLYYQADIQSRLGKSEEAVKILEDMTARYPLTDEMLPLAHVKLGTLYMKMKNYEKALDVFRRVAESRAPVFRDVAMHYVAMLYRRTARVDEAAEYEKKLAELFPESPYAVEIKAKMDAEAKAQQQQEKKDETETGGDNRQ